MRVASGCNTAGMAKLSEYRQVEFRSRSELRDWFQRHHLAADPFWLVSYKKHVSEFYLPYGDIVEELLCFGWIDGRTRRVDDQRTMLLVAPRKPGSTWSAPNKKRIARLRRAGLLMPHGAEKVAAAKKDGSWSFLDDIDALILPPDLETALTKNRRAARNFDRFNAAAKKVILLWIKTARRDETRKRRIAETVRLAAKNIKAAHPEARGK